MDLRETVQALEAKNVVVALDLGVHEHCLLDSNCPKAVELRTLIGQSGTTMAQLLEGYAVITTPVPVNIELPQIDTHVTVAIGGKHLELDLNDAVGNSLRLEVERKLRDIGRANDDLTRWGTSLFNSYTYEARRLRNSKVLPQLRFDVKELTATKCVVSGDDKNYFFLFPVTYKPEYIVDNGIRSKLRDEDVAGITREVWLQFTITPECKFLGAELLQSNGGKFQHYHGAGADCWGTITFPVIWDRKLVSLHHLSILLMKSLATINYNSIFRSHPLGFTHTAGALLQRATVLGREGVVSQPVQAEEIAQQPDREGRVPAIRGWRR